MTSGYNIFTHVFSFIAVASCIVWGILKNRQPDMEQNITIPEPELDL